ncbi:MAG: family 20 glycosylhydrolase [Chthonomonas sp.]|nr:family 20 glycosylhydrolase [Chthonomonas sp.]
MQLKMWTYDLAREQAPTLDHLYQIASFTQDAGFNALGLYMEHRYAYPSTPWAHGKGCVTPEMISRLRSEFPSLTLVPFINLLGHFEGFLYTEHGKQYREELFSGLQASPANPSFVELCRRIIDDTCAAFDSEIIHIGGDETWQLGANEASKARIHELTGGDESLDGKALLYGSHFGPLAEYVVEKGRRPAVWGDMYHDHPTALDFMPKSTLIFEWQYFKDVKEWAPFFKEKGFEVVGCPAIQTYNATWLHVEASEKNVREIADDVRELNLFGECITTWECGMFGAYDTLFPALRASASILNGSQGSFYEAYAKESPQHESWARLMSEQLSGLGGTFTPGQIRSSLKTRLLLMSNPFLCWMHHAEEFCHGDRGEKASEIANRALQIAPEESYKGPAMLLRSAVDFVRIAEEARLEYAHGHAEASVAKLAASRQVFDDLSKYARWNHQRIGGSLADIERCRIAKEWIEKVMQRVRTYGDGSLGYLPAWEIITHPKFVPHDQASWWLINRWANQ